MSVLKSLKGTIVGVQHDISASFKNLRIKKPEDVPSSHPESGIKLDAGADLLNKFQTQWAELHDLSEGNARAADDVDSMVTELFLYLERQNDAVGQFMNELATMPQLAEQLDSAVTKLGQVSGEFAELDSLLLQLEDAIEAHELQVNKKRNEHQLHLYRQKKDVELEITKVRLAKQHAQKSQQYEARLQETLMVRQKAFEEAYNEEIENYKLYGQTDFKPSPTVERRVDLGDISIDDDDDDHALDDFFKDVGATVEAPTATATTDALAIEPATTSDAGVSADHIEPSIPTAADDLNADDDDEQCSKVEVMQDEDYDDDDDVDETKTHKSKTPGSQMPQQVEPRDESKEQVTESEQQVMVDSDKAAAAENETSQDAVAENG